VRCEQRADNDGRDEIVAERQAIRGAEHLGHHRRDQAEDKRACVRLPEKCQVNLQPGGEHQEEFPKFGEEPRDRMIDPRRQERADRAARQRAAVISPPDPDAVVEGHGRFKPATDLPLAA